MTRAPSRPQTPNPTATAPSVAKRRQAMGAAEERRHGGPFEALEAASRKAAGPFVLPGYCTAVDRTENRTAGPQSAPAAHGGGPREHTGRATCGTLNWGSVTGSTTRNTLGEITEPPHSLMGTFTGLLIRSCASSVARQ